MFPVMSFVGIVVLIGIGYLCSANRRAVSWRLVLAALAVQLVFGGFVLFVPIGQIILQNLSDSFVTLLSYAREGSRFLLGNLIDFDKYDYIFVFDVFPVIIYFSALLAVLYHIGVMGLIIRGIGGALRFILGGSATECTAAAASIFVGNPELTVRPYLMKMTRSEIFVVFVAAMASISGEVVSGYIALGIPAPYIIAASLMTGPGCILFAKLLMPETERSPYDKIDLEIEKSANVLEAAAKGASDGLFISLNVGAMLLAFLSLIALINGIFGWLGGLVGFEGLTLQLILGKVLRFLTFLIGVPWADSEVAGQLIGLKVITNEFVAYSEFGANYIQSKDGVFQSFTGISPLAGAIISFAICGYANIGSIAVYLGSIGYLVPERRSELARLGVRALLAASLSNLLSGTIAGLFISIGGLQL